MLGVTEPLSSPTVAVLSIGATSTPSAAAAASSVADSFSLEEEEADKSSAIDMGGSTGGSGSCILRHDEEDVDLSLCADPATLEVGPATR